MYFGDLKLVNLKGLVFCTRSLEYLFLDVLSVEFERYLFGCSCESRRWSVPLQNRFSTLGIFVTRRVSLRLCRLCSSSGLKHLLGIVLTSSCWYFGGMTWCVWIIIISTVEIKDVYIGWYRIDRVPCEISSSLHFKLHQKIQSLSPLRTLFKVNSSTLILQNNFLWGVDNCRVETFKGEKTAKDW